MWEKKSSCQPDIWNLNDTGTRLNLKMICIRVVNNSLEGENGAFHVLMMFKFPLLNIFPSKLEAKAIISSHKTLTKNMWLI